MINAVKELLTYRSMFEDLPVHTLALSKGQMLVIFYPRSYSKQGLKHLTGYIDEISEKLGCKVMALPEELRLEAIEPPTEPAGDPTYADFMRDRPILKYPSPWGIPCEDPGSLTTGDIPEPLKTPKPTERIKYADLMELSLGYPLPWGTPCDPPEPLKTAEERDKLKPDSEELPEIETPDAWETIKMTPKFELKEDIPEGSKDILKHAVSEYSRKFAEELEREVHESLRRSEEEDGKGPCGWTTEGDYSGGDSHAEIP